MLPLSVRCLQGHIIGVAARVTDPIWTGSDVLGTMSRVGGGAGCGVTSPSS